jgi:hypothetical protein
MNNILRWKGSRTLPRLVFAGVIALSLAGCNTDEIVQVEDPAQLQPDATESPAAVPALVAGAVRTFEGGYSGLGDDAFVSSAGVISDEFAWGDSFTTRFAADRRTLQSPVLGNISDSAYFRLHRARIQAERVGALIDRFEDDLDDPDGMRASLRTTDGYVRVTLSEGWCGSVPFSSVPTTGPIDPSTIVFGPGQSVVQMNEAAIAAFDDALTLDPASELAMVGKARALLNLGRYAEAEAAVADVTDTFVYHIEHSTNTALQNNSLSSLIDNGRYSLANLEGGQNADGTALRPDRNTDATNGFAEGLNFRAAQDPRVPYESIGACFTASIDCWLYNNYPRFTSDVPLASGVEARLVEAEAALARGDVLTMLERLNYLRARTASLLPLLYPEQDQVFPAATAGAPSLPPLTDPGIGLLTPAEQNAARRNLVFRERAFWMFGTGHRQGDLRRLIRVYGLTQAQVFPTGPYARAAGSNYGTDVAYPVPFNEENNTQFVRAQCVTTDA